MPTWNDFVEPSQLRRVLAEAGLRAVYRGLKLTVPNLNVAGWWDQEDFYGPLKIYELLEKNDTQHQNYLVVGPWNHGGWAAGDGQEAGRHRFRQRHGSYFREKMQAPWFAY